MGAKRKVNLLTEMKNEREGEENLQRKSNVESVNSTDSKDLL